jgi:membrane-bound metal-dependent hydrolase YbcI (DUF457 family)
MDTITHAFAGALLGKAIFSSQKLNKESQRDEYSPAARVAIWATTLGSAFPDVDVFYDIASRQPMAALKYHRYITHSFWLMPVWAVGLAWVTSWATRRWGVRSPSLFWLWLCYLAGIASHILLDLATSFGTMCWSPLSRARPAWDIIFIIDFSFTAIVLLPQVAAWIARRPERALRRALRMWVLFAVLTVGVFLFGQSVGAGFAPVVIVIAVGLIGALFFLSAGWRPLAHAKRSTWSRAGVVAGLAYLAACTVLHAAALKRVREFAADRQISAEALGALPQAPSFWVWDGLIRTSGGVYEIREDLRKPPARDFDFFADSAPDKLLTEVRALPATQTYLWFARFPFFSYSVENGTPVLDVTDLRFFSRRSGRMAGFTYRVTFDSDGNLVHAGMLRDSR